MIVIPVLVILYFIFYFRYHSKKRKQKLVTIPQQKVIPIQKKQRGNLSKSINLNFDFTISDMMRKKDYLQVTLLIHNNTNQPTQAVLQNAFYISSKTKTQYAGDCTYLSYVKLGEQKNNIDTVILPGLNIKREASFYRFDLNEFYDEDYIIIQATFDNQLHTIKKQIFETDLQNIRLVR